MCGMHMCVLASQTARGVATWTSKKGSSDLLWVSRTRRRDEWWGEMKLQRHTIPGRAHVGAGSQHHTQTRVQMPVQYGSEPSM